MVGQIWLHRIRSSIHPHIVGQYFWRQTLQEAVCCCGYHARVAPIGLNEARQLSGGACCSPWTAPRMPNRSVKYHIRRCTSVSQAADRDHPEGSARRLRSAGALHSSRLERRTRKRVADQDLEPGIGISEPSAERRKRDCGVLRKARRKLVADASRWPFLRCA